MNIKILIFGISIFFAPRLFPQSSSIYYPTKGTLLKNHKFTDVKNYNQKNFSISDLKGKWLVFYLWNNGCISCIRSFPKLNKIAKDFKGRAELFMVGMTDKKTKWLTSAKTLALYNYHKAKYNLTAPFVFDSTIAEKYDVKASPLILILDPNGIIQAKTYTLDSLSLASLINGKSVEFPSYISAHEKIISTYDYTKPLLTTGAATNGALTDTGFAYRSLILKWNHDMDLNPRIIGLDVKWPLPEYRNFFEVSGINLASMIRLAYTGRTDWDYTEDVNVCSNIATRLIIESGDSAKFSGIERSSKYGVLKAVADKLYAYSLKLPEKMATPLNFQKYMLQDLQRYFGFKSEMTIRKAPVYKLIVIDQRKADSLKSKGGDQNTFYYEESREGIRFTNIPVSKLLKTFEFYEAIGRKDGFPLKKIIDETWISFNIDIDLNDNITDYNILRKILRSNGLDLIEGEADMICIVINSTPKQ
jgi:thiol-disulfide isomerase/thioredoxin